MTKVDEAWIKARIMMSLAVVDDASRTQFKIKDDVSVAELVERLYDDQQYMEVYELELDRILNCLPEQY